MANENDSVEHVTDPRVVVVTGASSGIGLAAAGEFARRGDEVVLVGRHEARLAEALAEVREAAAGPQPSTYRCDFAVLAEVRRLGEQLADAYPRIDVLANNAGGLGPAGNMTTVDGYEFTIQTNHLAPFLLTHLLRGRLAGGRIVNTASGAHQQGTLDPATLRPGRGSRPMSLYGSAKQANILFAAEAARRWPDVLSTSYHPGLVRTRFGRHNPVINAFFKVAVFLRSPARGADTLLWLADTPAGELVNGGYYVDRRLRRPSSRAADPAVAAALWEASRTAVGLT